jgi:hypothetical protein
MSSREPALAHSQSELAIVARLDRGARRSPHHHLDGLDRLGQLIKGIDQGNHIVTGELDRCVFKKDLKRYSDALR